MDGVPADHIVDAIMLLLCALAPIALSLALTVPGWRPYAIRLTPWGALPALLTPFVVTPGASVALPGVLLGVELGMDEISQVFLGFTSLLWLVGGFYARSCIGRSRLRFFTFYLLAMAGNLGLIIALDMVSFYTFYALMSFTAYGLIVHYGGLEAIRAGRVYMVFVVIGELLVFTGLILAFSAMGTVALADIVAMPPNHWVIGCLLLGFGIKAGLLPFHVYLPLAYMAAPSPAAVVMAGAMINAGLLGWLRTLPLGQQAIPIWSALMLAAGIGAVIYGVIAGLGQNNAKSVLAYSSITQMGLITVALGIGLAEPAGWPVALFAILVYALHHALAKGALFFSLGAAVAGSEQSIQRILVFLGLVLPSLSLAGAPFTSGAAAKLSLKHAAEMLPNSWYDWLAVFMAVAAVGTTLLMSRFVYLMLPLSRKPTHLTVGVWLPLLMLLVASAIVISFWPAAARLTHEARSWGMLWSTLWPIAIGGLLAWETLIASRGGANVNWVVPPGDILAPITRAGRRLHQHWTPIIDHIARTAAHLSITLRRNALELQFRIRRSPMERKIGRWHIAATFYLLVLVIMLGMLWTN